jgi:hypothetical protein
VQGSLYIGFESVVSLLFEERFLDVPWALIATEKPLLSRLDSPENILRLEYGGIWVTGDDTPRAI